MSKRKIFFHTNDGDGLALVPPLLQEKHEVIVHIKDPDNRPLYQGFIKRNDDIKHWANSATKNDLVIFDSVGSGIIGDQLRARGVPVFGGQVIADKLEVDRMFALKIASQCGIKVPYTVKFSNVNEGIKFVKNNPGLRLVHKAFGHEVPSADTFLAHDSEEMLSFLNSQKKKDYEFILQTFVEGIEYSTEMFFSDGNPVEPSYHTIETKKAYAGDLGIAVGCMSTVEIVDKSLKNKMVEKGIGKCFEWLKKIKYTGSLDFNTIIDKQGNVWMLEATPRMGYSSCYAQFALLTQELGQLFEDIATGKAKKVQTINDKFALMIRIGISPYPYVANNETYKYFKPLVRNSANKKVIINKVHKNIIYNFLDVKDGGENLVTAGCDGIVAEIGTIDKNIKKGYETIKSAIDDITIEDKFYRIDAFDRAIEQIPLIIKSGFYDGPEFKED